MNLMGSYQSREAAIVSPLHCPHGPEGTRDTLGGSKSLQERFVRYITNFEAQLAACTDSSTNLEEEEHVLFNIGPGCRACC